MANRTKKSNKEPTKVEEPQKQRGKSFWGELKDTIYGYDKNCDCILQAMILDENQTKPKKDEIQVKSTTSEPEKEENLLYNPDQIEVDLHSRIFHILLTSVPFALYYIFKIKTEHPSLYSPRSQFIFLTFVSIRSITILFDLRRFVVLCTLIYCFLYSFNLSQFLYQNITRHYSHSNLFNSFWLILVMAIECSVNLLLPKKDYKVLKQLSVILLGVVLTILCQLSYDFFMYLYVTMIIFILYYSYFLAKRYKLNMFFLDPLILTVISINMLQLFIKERNLSINMFV
ncbi:hypothetical protein TUBRATIS_002380 [Tubulinosema ratisbonensis]|uniref:Uncharacterized protein n=1 Tax=Tubulinosema ratisbonensis TaxID=291195 RepID=A0A437AQ03_9MICR|nr:hypothetical protein TUBRATIS_002380 [Tubulinosema ratisbonensis]